jgi:hypothetical protein
MKNNTNEMSNADIRSLRLKIIEHLKNIDLNWTARTEKIKTSQTGIVLPNKLAVIRNDNNKIIGIQPQTYEIFQNHEMLETVYHISQNIKYETGGMFDGGAKTYFQFKTDDLKLINSNGKIDTVKGYLTIINSFDDAKALAIGETNVTISCMNTFTHAYEDLEYKIAHNKNMRKKLAIVIKEIDIAINQEKQTFSTIKKMSETPIQEIPNIMNSLMKSMLGIKSKENLIVNNLTINDLYKYKIIMDNIEHEFKEKGETLWGLFSGITRYTTHNMKKTFKPKDKYYGAVAKKDKTAWKLLSNAISS